MLLRASAAPRWMFCAASAQDVPGQLDDEDTDEAREGTCAAWVAEVCIKAGGADPRDMIGQTHPENGWIVDAEMARHIGPYVQMAMKREGPRPEVYAETKIGAATVAGTSDLWSIEDGIACIDDLKYGFDIVEPRSWQLGVYMMLALETPGVKFDKVKLGIYQPRALHRDGPYRRVTLDAREINDWITAIRNQVAQIAGGSTIAQAGSHCSHCNKAAMCEALTHSVYTMYGGLARSRIEVPTGQQLTDEFDFLERAASLLKARKTAVHAEIEARLDSAKFVPGLAREPRPGKRKFKDHLTPRAIEVLTGIDPTETDLCTPAELERRGVDKELVDALTYTPNTGRRLTRVTSDDIAKRFERK